MSGKFYNKYLTFLQDQPFAENLLTGFYYKKRRAKLPSKRDSSFSRLRRAPLEPSSKHSSNPTRVLNNDINSSASAAKLCLAAPQRGDLARSPLRVSFGSIGVRNKSEKMRKAETSLVNHFCLLLERTEGLHLGEPVQGFRGSNGLKNGHVLPHLLASVDSIQNTLLATRGSRSSERAKTPSQFKKVLRECRKVRLLYGNLSKRHLSRATNKKRLSGENLLLWLESRLDVVLERCGFFGSIKAARQSVLSGKIVVNSKVVRSPGLILKGGDLIRVVQERLLFDSLEKQLSREVILRNEVQLHLTRNKSLATTLSKLLPKYNTTPPTNPSLAYNKGSNREAGRGFDFFRSPVRTLPSYKSYYTWLLKKKSNFQSSEHLRYVQSGALQLRSAELEIERRQRKELSSSKGWRFFGSPHLLFSFFFLHAHLQRVLSFIAQGCNKAALVDKKTVKTLSPAVASCFGAYKASLNVPTISSASKYCAINTFSLKAESHLNPPIFRERSSKDAPNIEFFLNLIRQSYQETNKEGVVVALSKVYNTILTSPWFISLKKGEYLSSVLPSSSAPLRTLGSKEKVVERVALTTTPTSRLVSREEKSLLELSSAEQVVFFDLLLYSLLIRKEVVCGYLQSRVRKHSFAAPLLSPLLSPLRGDRDRGLQTKDQLDPNNKKASRPWHQIVTKSKKHKTFDSQGSFNLGLPVASMQELADISGPARVGNKKFKLSKGFDLAQAKRTKPLHLEISYKSLCAVYLFPPQRVCVPVLVDVDCLAKAF